LANSMNGLTVAELVGLLRTPDTRVRRELSTLVATGAVAAIKDDPTGPGRPRLRFRLAPKATAWPEVVQLLLSALGRHEPVDDSVLREIAYERGAAMAAGEFPRGVVDAMALMGFAPHERSSRREAGQQISRVSFENCPFRDVVAADGGEAVCVLHHGLTDGLTAALGGRLDSFEIRDPTVAACEITLLPRTSS